MKKYTGFEMVRGKRCLNPFACAIALAVCVFVPATAVPAEACKLVVLGDSLSAGYGVEAEEAFPAQMAQRLELEGVDCDVINAGVSGDTTAGGAARIGWVLADQPSHLLIELGGNDALRALPVDQLRDNLAVIVEQAQGAGVEVMLAGMLAPPNLGKRYGDAFAGAYQELADEYDLAFYPFFLDGLIGRPELFIEDGIHPNARGVSVIVDRIAPKLISFLSSR